MREAQIVKRLENVATLTAGRLRRSQRNVPHVLVQRGGMTFSVAYFAKASTYKVFSPWPSRGAGQNCVHLLTADDVAEYLNERVTL